MDFDEKFKVYHWYHWMNLHWIINPGLAVNELLLGQRIPKTRLEDQSSNKTRDERTYIPCPHCEEKHKSITWSRKNETALKNWFGFYCPACGEIIPCIMNVTTFIILAITFPIWGWFKNRLKSNWLDNQPTRFENLDLNYTAKKSSSYGWIKSGLTWGAIMFVFMTLLFPLIEGQAVTWNYILLSVPVWAITGLFWAYIVKWYTLKKRSGQTMENT